MVQRSLILICITLLFIQCAYTAEQDLCAECKVLARAGMHIKSPSERVRQLSLTCLKVWRDFDCPYISGVLSDAILHATDGCKKLGFCIDLELVSDELEHEELVCYRKSEYDMQLQKIQREWSRLHQLRKQLIDEKLKVMSLRRFVAQSDPIFRSSTPPKKDDHTPPKKEVPTPHRRDFRTTPKREVPTTPPQETYSHPTQETYSHPTQPTSMKGDSKDEKGIGVYTQVTVHWLVLFWVVIIRVTKDMVLNAGIDYAMTNYPHKPILVPLVDIVNDIPRYFIPCCILTIAITSISSYCLSIYLTILMGRTLARIIYLGYLEWVGIGPLSLGSGKYGWEFVEMLFYQLDNIWILSISYSLFFWAETSSFLLLFIIVQWFSEFFRIVHNFTVAFSLFDIQTVPGDLISAVDDFVAVTGFGVMVFSPGLFLFTRFCLVMLVCCRFISFFRQLHNLYDRSKTLSSLQAQQEAQGSPEYTH